MKVGRLNRVGITLGVAAALSACAAKSGPSCEAPAAPAGEAQTQPDTSAIPNDEILTTGFLKAGQTIVVDVRDHCPAPGKIASLIPDRFEGVTKSGERSYTWNLPFDVSADEFQRMAASDPCVVRLSESRFDQLSPQPPVGMETSSETEAMPNDPGVGLEKHLYAIGAPAAYDIFFDSRTGIKKEVVIAIIDTGVRIDHEDLRNNLWVNRGEIPNNRIDDDRNGYVDDVFGYNFESRIASPMPQKTYANASWIWAHGTRVAGLAAASGNNGKGGVGAHYRAKIMSLNVLGGGSAMDQAKIANAIRYAVDNGASVINLSLGGNNGQVSSYREALKYAIANGVVVLAAAGNESMAIGERYSAAGLAPSYQGLISIGNFQSQNYLKDTTSNYSPTYVELGAPGINTMYNQLYTTSPESASSYSYFAGTSAAVPVASGAAALAISLMKSRGYAVTAGEIERLLLESARKISALRRYFRDGNALDLGQLAKLVDGRYPAKGASVGDAPIESGSTPDPGRMEESPGGAGQCAGV